MTCSLVYQLKAVSQERRCELVLLTGCDYGILSGMQRATHTRYLAPVLSWSLLISWISIIGIWLFAIIELTELEVGLLFVGVFAASALVLLGKGRLTAWLGSSTIGIGALVFVTDVIGNGLFNLIESVRLVALAVIFTGIVLERVSPAPALQPWMFLLIATKVEFIIITALMSSVLASGHTLVKASVVTWWILIVLMLASSLALWLHSKLLYQAVWYATATVSLTLFVVLVPLVSFSSFVVVWAIAATLWPPVAVRLIKKTADI